MPGAVGNFIRRMTSPTHAGRGRDQSSASSVSSNDNIVDPTQSSPSPRPARKAGRKAKPCSPAESLLGKDNESRATRTAGPGASKRLHDERHVSDSIDDSSLPVSRVLQLLDSFREEFRGDMRIALADLLAPLENRMTKLERQILQLQKQSEKLQTDVNKCKAAGDKANSDVDNGGKSAIVVDLRRQVDGLSAKLSDVVDNLPNKVDLATLVQETTSSRTQQVHVMRDVMAEEVA